MRYIELFGGIGGFGLGIEQATKATDNRWECVWYCDNNKYATTVYNQHFAGKGDLRYEPTDVRTVPSGDIPDHDLICAGFPCQSFSIAGRRKGFEDTRGTLFFEICRIARDHATPYLLLENVKGLLSHDRRRTFGTILTALDELGYRLQWEVLNSKNFGVPQNRERVFIVASLRDRPAPQIFPLGQSGEELAEVERASEEGRAWMANERDKWQDAVILHNIYGGFGETEPRVFEDCSPTIRTPAGGGHIPVVLGTITEAIGTRQGSSSEFLRSVNNIQKTTGSIRRLTPTECERLQGFPDGWTNVAGISDTQKYKMLGNAVTVNVVQAIVGKWIR